MSLPITLPIGVVAVYGNGYNDTNPFGIVMPANYKFGSVYNIWDGGSPYMAVYDKIMFREQDVVQRIVLASNNHPYTLVPARLATKQYPEL